MPASPFKKTCGGGPNDVEFWHFQEITLENLIQEYVLNTWKLICAHKYKWETMTWRNMITSVKIKIKT